MVESYKKMWANFANFEGRTSRNDYWYAFVMNLIVSFCIGFVLGFISGMTGIKEVEYLSYIYSLAVFIPGLSIAVRRLHDTNTTGWYILIELIPIVGFILLLIKLCTDSVEPNNYGTQV